MKPALLPAGPGADPASRQLSRRSLGQVTGNRPLGSLVWLTVAVSDWPGARPGQFALLQRPDSRCFLGRALSVAQEDGPSVSFLIAPVGEGTRELCALRPGEMRMGPGPSR